MRAVVVVALLSACTAQGTPPAGDARTTASTTPGTTTAATAPPTSSVPPTSTAGVPAGETFPLAVVTGITNLRAVVSVSELRTLAGRGQLVVPCGVDVVQPTVTKATTCTKAADVVAALKKSPTRVALLPPGLVQPATKVLSIRGSGPYGMFGPDLFGDAAARALPYPVTGRAAPRPGQSATDTLDPTWTAYDRGKVWTMTNLGSLCSDRGAAIAAVVQKRGWGWVFGGGTARYPSPAPVDPPNHEPFRSVQPIETGNGGAMASLIKRSDVAIADHECPVVPNQGWKPRTDTVTVFSVPEAVLPHWRDTFGLDLVYLAANHMSDKGVSGIRSTLRLIDAYKIPRTGLGMNLDEALRPAYVEVAGLKVGFVAFNDVVGVARADSTTPGVAWITKANVVEGVRRAKQGGADLVVCNPQWWGGAEYHNDLKPLQRKQIEWFDAAGCDHVIGSGTHVAGPMLVRGPATDPNVVLVSPGNHLFGQGWWQETQEGIVLDLSFRGTTLVNVRLRPTVMVRQARPVLLDPQGDGRSVLQRVWKYSTVG